MNDFEEFGCFTKASDIRNGYGGGWRENGVVRALVEDDDEETIVWGEKGLRLSIFGLSKPLPHLHTVRDIRLYFHFDIYLAVRVGGFMILCMMELEKMAYIQEMEKRKAKLLGLSYDDI